jgi:hypothetical protein
LLGWTNNAELEVLLLLRRAVDADVDADAEVVVGTVNASVPVKQPAIISTKKEAANESFIMVIL